MSEPVYLAANAEEALITILVSLFAAARKEEVTDLEVADYLMGKSWDELTFQGLKWLEEVEKWWTLFGLQLSSLSWLICSNIFIHVCYIEMEMSEVFKYDWAIRRVDAGPSLLEPKVSYRASPEDGAHRRPGCRCDKM